MDVFDRLKAAAAPAWASYVEHDFVRQMGDGTLPEAAFRTYLVQDYLFLIQFARAYALATYKSRTLADMRAAKAGLSAILDVEMDLHVRLCSRWGLSPKSLEESAEEQATVAYTRFVLDCGAAGDLLDLHIALAPCVIGYAEIGRALASTAAAGSDGHPYRDWIGEYAGDAYQEIAAAARSMTEARFGDLVRLFATASRLEADFWSIALGTPATSAISGPR